MSYVYVIHGSHGMVKVGHSGNPRARVRELQTGSPYALCLDYQLYVGGRAEAVETEAHAILERHRGLGEWFDVSSDVAVAAIGAAAFRLQAFAEAQAEREPWKKRFLVLSIALTPTWLLHTPVSFCAVVFVFLAYAAYCSFSYRGPRLVQIARWLGIAGASALTSISVATILAAPAHATEVIPTYDSSRYCDNLAALLGDQPIIKDGCLTSEKEARAKVKSLWIQVPVDIQSQCIKTIAAGSAGSYQGLGGCMALMIGQQWYEGKLSLRP